MSEFDPKDIVLRFNDCINNKDLRGLSELMAENHVFIDSDNNVQRGKEVMTRAWDRFFTQFPDYRNELATIEVRSDRVYITGRSHCSVGVLSGPALWTARVRNGLIVQWRVYRDTHENRHALNLPVGDLLKSLENES